MKRLTIILMVSAMVISTAAVLCAADQPVPGQPPGVATVANALPDSVLASLRGTGDQGYIDGLNNPALSAVAEKMLSQPINNGTSKVGNITTIIYNGGAKAIVPEPPGQINH
jgi:hypothetical protein